MEAEMVGVDRLYRTADHWGADFHGRPVQVHCDRGALRLTALD
jgi:septum site-determining protein MinC